MTDIVSPDMVTNADGTQLAIGGSSSAAPVSPREVWRSVVDTFPGQSAACPVCGAMATDAPEGVHGFHVPADAINHTGDAVWQAEHCFKCGYRPGDTAVKREADLYGQFKKWLAAATAEDMAHRTLNPPSSADEMAKLTDLASRLGVKIAPMSSEV